MTITSQAHLQVREGNDVSASRCAVHNEAEDQGPWKGENLGYIMGRCFEHSEAIIQLYNELRICIYIYILKGYNRIQQGYHGNQTGICVYYIYIIYICNT